MNPTYYNPNVYSMQVDLKNRFVVMESVLNALHVDMTRMSRSISALEYAFQQQQQRPQQQQQPQYNGYESSIPLRLFSPDVKPTLPYRKQNRYKSDESSLAKYLEKDEQLVFSLSDTEEKSYVLKAVFNGVQLQVTECESVPSLLSLKSNKPGSVLHRFVSELRKNGLSVSGPVGSSWNYCNVVRDGVTSTLMELSKK